MRVNPVGAQISGYGSGVVDVSIEPTSRSTDGHELPLMKSRLVASIGDLVLGCPIHVVEHAARQSFLGDQPEVGNVGHTLQTPQIRIALKRPKLCNRSKRNSIYRHTPRLQLWLPVSHRSPVARAPLPKRQLRPDLAFSQCCQVG